MSRVLVFSSFAGLDSSRFGPFHFCPCGLTEEVQDSLSSFHVGTQDLNVQSGVVRKRLVLDVASSWEGQALDSKSRVV